MAAPQKRGVKRQDRNKWTHLPGRSTLYVNNLNDKLSKNELKKNLYYWYSQFGHVLDIVALKTSKMRGQAFVIFEDQNSATEALHASKEKLFFGKAMNASYAKTESDVTKARERLLNNPKRRKITQKRHNESRILVQNLPLIAQQKYIEPLFQEFQGFVRAELVPGKPGQAYVDFQTRLFAQTAVDYLAGFELSPRNKLTARFLHA